MKLHSSHACLAWMVVALLLSVDAQGAGITALAPNGDLIPLGAPTAHTQIPPASIFDGSKVSDNLISSNVAPADTGLIFYGSETFSAGLGTNAQLLALTGFNSAIGEIWIYTLTSDQLRVPDKVTIRSSATSQTSLNPLDYPTTLVSSLTISSLFTNLPTVDTGQDPFYAPSPTIGARYAIIPVSAPAGTQSLFFDFDAGPTFGGNGARIQEIQAFVPEPSSLLLSAIGLAGGLALRRRRGART